MSRHDDNKQRQFPAEPFRIRMGEKPLESGKERRVWRLERRDEHGTIEQSHLKRRELG